MERTVMHVLGVVGLLLMAWSAFGYSWRKSVMARPPMTARTWLDVHMITGGLGALFVLVHGGVGHPTVALVTSALVVIVVVSGLVGRYVYTAAARQPRHELAADLARLDDEIAGLEQSLVAEPARDAGDWPGGGGTSVMTRRAMSEAVEAELRALRGLRDEQERRLHVAARLSLRRKVLALWWVFHVPVAMAMFALALVHTGAILWFRAS